MKKEYLKPTAEIVSFQVSEEVMGPTGSMGVGGRPRGTDDGLTLPAGDHDL